MPTIGQIDLIASILRHLERIGCATVNVRQHNAVIAAADLIVAAFAEEHRPATTASGLAAWLASDDTGLSSRVMVWRLAKAAGLDTPIPRHPAAQYEHPDDPSDLGRCLRLLDAVPELRPHLPLMADASPTWARLVAVWGELSALYREELPTGKAPKLYRRMKEIRDQKPA